MSRCSHRRSHRAADTALPPLRCAPPPQRRTELPPSLRSRAAATAADSAAAAAPPPSYVALCRCRAELHGGDVNSMGAMELRGCG